MLYIEELQNEMIQLTFPVPEDFVWVYPLSCGYQKMQSNYSVTAQKGIVLAYVLNGYGAVDIGGVSSNFFADCLLMANTKEGIFFYPEVQTDCVYLTLENGSGFLGKLQVEGCVKPFESTLDISSQFANLFRSIRADTLHDVYQASSAVFGLLMLLMKHMEGVKVEYSTLVRNAIKMIHGDFAYIGGVAELAQELDVSKHHLIRCFSLEAGISPGKYLQRIRIQNAKLLLENRDYDIDAVSSMVGYSGANYFCKVFRKETGESPGQYRNRCLQTSTLDINTRQQLLQIEKSFV